MKQMSLVAGSGFAKKRKQVFLQEMNPVVPWPELVALIEPHTPKVGPKGGRPAFGTETMLRIHFLQQWFGLSDVAMEEALFDVPLYRQFAGLGGVDRIPDRVSILRFRHLLERHELAARVFATVSHPLGRAWLAAQGRHGSGRQHHCRAQFHQEQERHAGP